MASDRRLCKMVPDGDQVALLVREKCTAQQLLAAAGLTKRTQERAFSQGLLACEGAVLARYARLDAGDVAVLHLVCTRTPGVASDGSVEVVWRDRFALAADKPTGLLVHGDGTAAPTLTARVQGMLAREATEQGRPNVLVPQPINRLDVETSGLVLFSLTEEFQPAFDALVANHDPAIIRKRYLCVVGGRFPRGTVVMDSPIARDRHDARRMRVAVPGKGRAARTLAACLDYRAGRSLVACELRSGRRHQIRVHLASVGHPIVGDALYGHDGSTTMLLHASELEFTHPVTGERVMLYTDWPKRFASLFRPRDVDWSILEE